MDEAFLELLEKKDLAYITVKEICARAGVNRSTFYLHYETINDLLNESAQHIIDQFVGSMPHDTRDFIGRINDRPLDELYLITPEYLTPYLNYVKEHRRVFCVALDQAATLGMDDAYLGLRKHVLTPILERYSVPPDEQKYMMPFFISGIMAIISEWLKSDCADPVEKIVSVIQKCVKHH